MSLTQCDVCGLMYCSDVGSDVRQHNKRHRAAIAARDALEGVGPRPLPINYHDREELKREARRAIPRDGELVMWSHFARSLDYSKFDVKKHPSWSEYVALYPNLPSSIVGLEGYE